MQGRDKIEQQRELFISVTSPNDNFPQVGFLSSGYVLFAQP